MADESKPWYLVQSFDSIDEMVIEYNKNLHTIYDKTCSYCEKAFIQTPSALDYEQYLPAHEIWACMFIANQKY